LWLAYWLKGEAVGREGTWKHILLLSLFSVSTIQKTLMAGCGMELTE
jgi:hypothetical protein